MSLCLGLIKIKSNPSSAAWEEEDRDPWTTMPPFDITSCAQHRRDMTPICHHTNTAQMEDVTQGPASHVASLQRDPPQCGGQMEKKDVERLEHYGERWNWRLEGGEDEPAVRGKLHLLRPW